MTTACSRSPRLRTGRELDVLNSGPAGVLVETVGGCFRAHGWTCTCSPLTVRAFVSGVSAEQITYRGALAFDQFAELAPDPHRDLA